MSELISRRSPVMSKSSSDWSRLAAALPRAPLRPTGTGTNDSLGRRPTSIAPVGPFGPIMKGRSGGSWGELMMGLAGSDAAMSTKFGAVGRALAQTEDSAGPGAADARGHGSGQALRHGPGQLP